MPQKRRCARARLQRVTIAHAVVPIRQFLAARSRRLRMKRRQSQSALGRRSAPSGKFIGDVERGDKSISLENLYRVARALRLSLCTLTNFRGDDASSSSLAHHRLFAMLVTTRPPAVIRAYRVVAAMLMPLRATDGDG